MAMYAGIFIGDFVKSMALKEHHSGTTMSQMELQGSQDPPNEMRVIVLSGKYFHIANSYSSGRSTLRGKYH